MVVVNLVKYFDTTVGNNIVAPSQYCGFRTKFGFDIYVGRYMHVGTTVGVCVGTFVGVFTLVNTVLDHLQVLPG